MIIESISEIDEGFNYINNNEYGELYQCEQTGIENTFKACKVIKYSTSQIFS